MMNRADNAPAATSKRSKLQLLIVLLALLAVACGGNDAETTTADGTEVAEQDRAQATSTDAAEPLRVGVVLPYTGPFGLYGNPMEAAFTAQFDRIDNEINGRPVEIIFEDDATDGATAVQRITKLIERDEVHVIACCVGGASTIAAAPILQQAGVPQLSLVPQSDDMAEFPNAFVVAPSVTQDTRKLGTYAAEQFGKSAVMIATDFSYGHDIAEAFAQTYEDAGGEIVKETFVPLGTTDFGSYIADLGDADVVFGGFAGGDAIAFVQQYDQFGAQAPLVGHGPLISEIILPAQGQAAIGVGGAFYYSTQLDNDENREMLETVGNLGEVQPSHAVAGAWATAATIIDALSRVDDPMDAGALVQAIRETSIDVPWGGQLEFDPDTGYAIAPTYFYRVVERKGELVHEIVGELGE